MKLNTFLTIGAVLAAIYGLGFLIIPAQTMGLYGITLEENGLFVARYLGSAFLGVAVLSWLARGFSSQEALRAVILANLVISVTGLVVALWEGFSGIGNSLRWATVVIYLFLTLGFGYFQVLASPGSRQVARQ